jgi:hypothetical protein
MMLGKWKIDEDIRLEDILQYFDCLELLSLRDLHLLVDIVTMA